MKGQISKIIIDIANAITPPNLLGIERKIAYAIKKYHSGWIWTGVTKGFAGIKFSGSPKVHGHNRQIIDKANNMTKKQNKYLVVKLGFDTVENEPSKVI